MGEKYPDTLMVALEGPLHLGCSACYVVAYGSDTN
jgi:hypothetical protein